MNIGKDFKIEPDNMNVILYQKKRHINKKTGLPYFGWETIGFFATVPNALHALVNQGIRDTNLKDLKTIVAKINELHNAIDLLPQRLTEA